MDEACLNDLLPNGYIVWAWAYAKICGSLIHDSASLYYHAASKNYLFIVLFPHLTSVENFVCLSCN